MLGSSFHGGGGNIHEGIAANKSEMKDELMNDCLDIFFCQHLLCKLRKRKADLSFSWLHYNDFAYLQKDMSPTFPQIKTVKKVMGKAEQYSSK